MSGEKIEESAGIRRVNWHSFSNRHVLGGNAIVMGNSIQQSTQSRTPSVMKVLVAIVLGGFGGFCVFGLGLTVIAFSTDGSHNEMAQKLHLTPRELDALLPIGAIGSIVVGAIVCGFGTARFGTIVFGPRTQWMIRGVLIGAVGITGACFVVALAQGDTPQFHWSVLGAEWALRFTPISVPVGAVFGAFAHQISSRQRLRHPR